MDLPIVNRGLHMDTIFRLGVSATFPRQNIMAGQPTPPNIPHPDKVS